ncbi:hypothetical protein ACFYY2_07610 [Streptomyces sp. NPDC001822]|uniref:hypothetical protein n=1 Tax=Streptomyces sp. NPDC001822 TaxID=3364614 RepID=UPI0036B4CA91
MTDVLATSEDGRYRVRMVRDENAQNPRESADTLVHVVTIDTHLGQYGAVDEDGGPLAEQWRRLAWNKWRGIETFTRYVALMHGGIVLESAPEKGPRSLWYMTGEEAIALDGGLMTEAYVEAEMQEYEAWLAGDVWGFVVETTRPWYLASGEWAPVDAPRGFYGGTYARAQARECLAFYAAQSAGTS